MRGCLPLLQQFPPTPFLCVASKLLLHSHLQAAVKEMRWEYEISSEQQQEEKWGLYELGEPRVCPAAGLCPLESWLISKIKVQSQFDWAFVSRKESAPLEMSGQIL